MWWECEELIEFFKLFWSYRSCYQNHPSSTFRFVIFCSTFASFGDGGQRISFWMRWNSERDRSVHLPNKHLPCNKNLWQSLKAPPLRWKMFSWFIVLNTRSCVSRSVFWITKELICSLIVALIHLTSDVGNMQIWWMVHFNSLQISFKTVFKNLFGNLDWKSILNKRNTQNVFNLSFLWRKLVKLSRRKKIISSVTVRMDKQTIHFITNHSSPCWNNVYILPAWFREILIPSSPGFDIPSQALFVPRMDLNLLRNLVYMFFSSFQRCEQTLRL